MIHDRCHQLTNDFTEIVDIVSIISLTYTRTPPTPRLPNCQSEASVPCSLRDLKESYHLSYVVFTELVYQIILFHNYSTIRNHPFTPERIW